MPLFTRSNITERRQSIIWSELTKTFQGALTIAQKSGLHYIWINSSCTIQDDA